MTVGFSIGDWCWHARQASPCRVIDRETLWGEVFFRVWLPAKDAVVRARVQDLGELPRFVPGQPLAIATACTPDLNAVLMLRIGHPGGVPA
ncbi:MAG: hypothetical protein ACOZB1_02755 [Pseudomonadota bacterium]